MKANTDSKMDESPLSREQLSQIGVARMNAARILRASQIAHREYVGLVIMGVLTAMFALYGGVSISALIMGIWMIVGGVVEHIGEQRIRRLDPSIFPLLSRNQLLLGAMFVVISAWWMLTIALGWDKDVVVMWLPVTGKALDNLGVAAHQMMPMVKLIRYAAYGSVGVFGIFWQGYLAWYYRRRQQQLLEYIEETPKWIVDMQQSGHLG
ncbi:MAG: hypothetical protein ACP5I8_12295 [Phycisphaerae bacterium]